jgi:hypothetical protein
MAAQLHIYVVFGGGDKNTDVFIITRLCSAKKNIIRLAPKGFIKE